MAYTVPEHHAPQPHVGPWSRAPEPRYGHLVQLSPDAILVLRDGRLEFANAAALALFGASSMTELVARPALELFHPGDHGTIVERIRRLDDGEVQTNPSIELTILRLDGTTRIVESASASFEDADGRGLEVALRDVSDRKQAEEALRASEERLRAHIDNSPLAVVEFDPEFRVTRWSKEAERLFGWTAGEIIGRKIAELRWVHEDDVESVRSESARLLSGRGKRTLNVNRNYRKDGSIVHCEWYSSALHDAHGRLISILSQVLDVTARTRAEEELRRSEAALRDADHRKTDFLAELSHELRNCLAPIKNCLRLMERTPPGSPPFERAREILDRQMNGVTSLVDDLLDLSRVHTGKIRLERTRLDVRDVVRRACEDVRSLFEERGLALRLESPGEPRWVDADEARLTQIISNLLGNALKFTLPPGAVDVSLRADERTVELCVRDTGIGIEPRLLDTLFEPFTQAEGTRESARGMGLGLALVKSLATMHGGTVRAHSEGKGRGSQFVVSLPRAAPPAAPARPPSRLVVPSLSILLVEDDRDAAETLDQLLRLQGHRTRVAHDALSAVASFRRSTPEVLVCDVGLPDLSGHELVGRLRQLDRSFFAIALTGYAQAGDVARARAAGFDAHLPKPASLARLDALLAEAAGAR